MIFVLNLFFFQIGNGLHEFGFFRIRCKAVFEQGLNAIKLFLLNGGFFLQQADHVGKKGHARAEEVSFLMKIKADFVCGKDKVPASLFCGHLNEGEEFCFFRAAESFGRTYLRLFQEMGQGRKRLFFGRGGLIASGEQSLNDCDFVVFITDGAVDIIQQVGKNRGFLTAKQNFFMEIETVFIHGSNDDGWCLQSQQEGGIVSIGGLNCSLGCG